MDKKIQYNSDLINEKILRMSSRQKKKLTDFLEKKDIEVVAGKINIGLGITLIISERENNLFIEDITISSLNSINKIILQLLMSFFFLFLVYIIYNKYFNQGNPNIPIDLGSGLIMSGEDYITGTIVEPIEMSEYQDYLKLVQNKKITLIISSNPVYSKFDISDGVGNTERVMDIRNKYSRRINSPIENIAKGYLYVVASANNGSLSDKESIYLYFGNYGGHLYKKYSIKLPTRNDGKLHLLYPLDKIIFADLPTKGYDDNKDMGTIEKNWIDIFNNTKSSIYFFGFVSTSRQGKLEEVTITYE